MDSDYSGLPWITLYCDVTGSAKHGCHKPPFARRLEIAGRVYVTFT